MNVAASDEGSTPSVSTNLIKPMQLTLEQAFELDVEELSVGSFDIGSKPTYIKVKHNYTVEQELFNLEDCIDQLQHFKDSGYNLDSELDELKQSLETFPDKVKQFILDHKDVRFYRVADNIILIKTADIKKVSTIKKKDHLGRIKGILTIDE